MSKWVWVDFATPSFATPTNLAEGNQISTKHCIPQFFKFNKVLSFTIYIYIYIHIYIKEKPTEYHKFVVLV